MPSQISNRRSNNIMVYSTRGPVLAIGLYAVIVFTSGCKQENKVTVTGSVVRGGQPIACSANGYVQVILQPDVDAGEQYTTRTARCEKDGTFKIIEVSLGKYKVGIEQLDPNPQIDKLKGEFRAGESKVIRDIDGKAPLTIDLAKPNLGL